MRRLTALNCLYQLTADDRLVTPMTAEVGVLTGPRYYGPPYHKVHNHGLMANLAVLRARLLGRHAWISTALARMSTEAPLAFSRWARPSSSRRPTSWSTSRCGSRPRGRSRRPRPARGSCR